MRVPVPCPCCGKAGFIQPALVLDGLHLTGMERRLAARLVRSFGRVVDYPAILDALYGDDPDGGPLGARDTIKVYAHTLRRKVAAAGLVVDREWGVGYRLRWASPEAAEAVAA